MPGTVPLGDRPLVDCLDSFWQGEFTLRTDAEEPTPEAELDPSGITVRGRDLAALLAPAYRELTRRH